MIDARGQGLLFAQPPEVPGVDRSRLIERRVAARRATARRRRIAEGARASHAERRARQDVLPLLFPIPTSTAECRGGPVGEVAEFIAEFGACPVLSCRYNLALWLKDNGSVKVEAGHVKGGTLRHSRRVRDHKLDRMADLVVELADRLGTLCLWDLLPAGADATALAERRPYMSYEQIGAVLGQSKEAARKIVDEADHAYQIAAAKLSRAQRRDRQAQAAGADLEADAKRARLRAGRDQLVQIRPRPPR